MSNPLQTAVAEMTLVPASEISKSLPSEARLLHFIFLFSLTYNVLLSHDEPMDLRRGRVVSVMLAVPPLNESE